MNKLIINKYLAISFIKMLGYSFLGKINKNVIIYRKMNLTFEKNSLIHSDMRFHLNLFRSNRPVFNSEILLRENSRLKVTGNFRLYSPKRIVINKNAKLILGSGYINNFVNINCTEYIKIGNNVAISENVIIRDSDNHILISDKESVSTKPIVIEDNVWIGMNVIVLKGVNIGEGAVVAAGSVVTRSVPANTLVAGVPARVVKNNIKWK